jgi:hypothetical protein
METTYLSNKKSASLFQEYCKKVIQTEFKKSASGQAKSETG